MGKGFVVKLTVGLAVVALLAVLIVMMVNGISGFVGELLDGGTFADEDGYYGPMDTPEPPPTMPAYIGEDSFYDSAGNVDFGD